MCGILFGSAGSAFIASINVRALTSCGCLGAQKIWNNSGPRRTVRRFPL